MTAVDDHDHEHDVCDDESRCRHCSTGVSSNPCRHANRVDVMRSP